MLLPRTRTIATRAFASSLTHRQPGAASFAHPRRPSGVTAAAPAAMRPQAHSGSSTHNSTRARFKSSDDAAGADAAPPSCSDDDAAAGAAAAADAGESVAPRFKHAFLIFNPAAGQENPASILGDVSLKLSAQMTLTTLQTQPGVAPEGLARRALDAGADLVIVSGGDGTVGAVAGALVDTGVPMGIIPRGTANAFSVALGIPTHLDSPLQFAVNAADVILQAHTVDVDTAVVDTSGPDGVQGYPMILLMGIGYEAETCASADRGLKDALGPLAYLLSGASKLVTASNFKARVVVDGEEAEGEVAAITIANAAPPFSVLAHGHTGDCIYDDGLLEAIGYVADEGGVTSPVVNVVNMVRLFGGVLFSDQPVQHDDRIFGGRYKEIRVECDPPQKVVLDGELLGETPVCARVKPGSLKVVVPAPPEAAATQDEERRAAAVEQEDVAVAAEQGEAAAAAEAADGDGGAQPAQAGAAAGGGDSDVGRLSLAAKLQEATAPVEDVGVPAKAEEGSGGGGAPSV